MTIRGMNVRRTVESDAALVFLFVATILLVFETKYFIFTSDEGIILEAAQRMMSGSQLYVDFFGYMSPGSYWLQESAFRVFGINLMSARLAVFLGFSLQCALIYWLTARLTSQWTALITALLFFLLQASYPGFLTAQHRWDSGTLALLSIVLVAQGLRRNRWQPWAVAGLAVALASVFTPSIGLVGLITIVWMTFHREQRRFLGAYVAGALSVTLLVVAYLGTSGLLRPFLDQIAWLARNYSAVNWMPYGAIIGGYGSLFEGVSPFAYLPVASVVACLALPAILPVISLAGWGWVWFAGSGQKLDGPSRRTIVYLVLVTVGLVITTYPRPDVMHLAFVAAVPYIASAALCHHYLRKAKYAVAYLLLWAVILGWNYAGRIHGAEPVETALGKLRVEESDHASVRRLAATVKAGDSAYVHPYMPILYFLTQTRNPTRYSYLAPGMMTKHDEDKVLTDLNLEPPKWLFYMPLTEEEFLRVFPNATELEHRFARLEEWIQERYEPLPQPLVVSGYELMRRKSADNGQALGSSDS